MKGAVKGLRPESLMKIAAHRIDRAKEVYSKAMKVFHESLWKIAYRRLIHAGYSTSTHIFMNLFAPITDGLSL